MLFAVKVPTPSKSLLTCLLKKEPADSCETLVNFKHLRRKHIPASLHFTHTCVISYFNLVRSSDDSLSHCPSPLKLHFFFFAGASTRFWIIDSTTPAAGVWRQLSSYAVRHDTFTVPMIKASCFKSKLSVLALSSRTERAEV